VHTATAALTPSDAGSKGGLKAPASSWYALAVLIGTTLFAFVDRQLLALIAPKFQAMLGLSDLQLGVLTGLGMAVFASAAAYPVGWLADRFGRRLVLAGCIVLWSASTAFCAFQSTFEGVFAATVGIAIGEAALAPIIFAMVPDFFPERQRNTANIVFFGAVLFGAAAGFGLGGLTLNWLETHSASLPGALSEMAPWRVALIAVSAPAPVFLLLLATLRMKGSGGRAAALKAQPEAEPFLPFIREHWKVFACLCGAMAAYGIPMGSAFTWLPVIMPRVFKTDVTQIGVQLGIALGSATLVGLLLPALFGRFMGRASPVKPLRMAAIFLIAGISPTVMMLVAWAPWQVYVAAAAQMALVLAAAALIPGMLQQISPPRLRSRLLAMQSIVTVLPQGLSPLLVGVVSGMIPGRRGLLTAVGLVSLPGWILAAFLMWRARHSFLTTAAQVKAREEAEARA
jgi:MFS family permease